MTEMADSTESFSRADSSKPGNLTRALEEDLDPETLAYLNGHHSPMQKRLYGVLQTAWFDVAFGILVCTNLFFIVLETNASVSEEGAQAWMVVIGYIFLAIYSLELAVRLYVFNFAFFRLTWNRIDMAIILADYIMIIVDLIFGGTPFVSFLRVLRLLRLTRSIKVMMMFPQLALMVRGFAAAVPVILWGTILLAFAVVVLGIFGTYLVHPVNQRLAEQGIYEGCERCPRAYATVYASAVTMVQQIIAGDSWGMMTIPIMEEEPVTSIFFATAFCAVGLLILNVLLAVVVESSLKAATEDAEEILKKKEVEFQKLARRLHAVCAEMDHDGSGSLTKRELIQGFDTNPQFNQIMALMMIERNDLEPVFNILDKDGSGDIDYDEFIKELYKMKSGDQQTMLVFIKYHLVEMKKMMTDDMRIHQHPGSAGPVAAEASASKAPSVAPPLSDTALQAKMDVGRLDFERDVREAFRDVQTALRKELCASVYDLVAKAEKQMNSLEDLRASLAQPMLLHHRGRSADGPPSKEPVNVPSSQCCVYEDARPRGGKIVVDHRVALSAPRRPGDAPRSFAPPPAEGAAAGGPPVRIVGVPRPDDEVADAAARAPGAGEDSRKSSARPPAAARVANPTPPPEEPAR